mmetsp:Transcript_31495/g.67031  ORF Transcript_31495/g.67031 Transcript_31495/m.67031 type:complete len:235 (-) Transcript_31495:634-1338(-)
MLNSFFEVGIPSVVLCVAHDTTLLKNLRELAQAGARHQGHGDFALVLAVQGAEMKAVCCLTALQPLGFVCPKKMGGRLDLPRGGEHVQVGQLEGLLAGLGGFVTDLFVDALYAGLQHSHHPLPVGATQLLRLRGYPLACARIVDGTWRTVGAQDAEDGGLFRGLRMHASEVKAKIGLLALQKGQLEEGELRQGERRNLDLLVGDILQGHCHARQRPQVLQRFRVAIGKCGEVGG